MATCFYLPMPPRAWSRVQRPIGCLPVDQMTLKGNVLQYRNNSSQLTKNQRYSKIAKGQWINRNTTWATQSAFGDGYTNPNCKSLKRVNDEHLAIDAQTGQILGNTLLPLTCPSVQPIAPNEALPSVVSSSSTNTPTVPSVVSPSSSTVDFPPLAVEPDSVPIVIANGGTLICSVVEDACTGQSTQTLSQKLCNPTSSSNVPGTIQELCWNDGMQTWNPKYNLTMSSSGNKWPVNATLVSAVHFN